MRLLRLLPVLFLMLAPVTAQAGARDDATEGAYRCASIGGLHQWLDCFYGAAQPVRAHMGLQPAPAAQIRLSLSPPPPGNSLPAELRLREDAMSTVLRCYAALEDRQWLDCYYGAVQPVRAKLGLTPGPQASPPVMKEPVTRAILAPYRAGEEQFGMAATLSVVAHHVDQITSRMTDYSFGSFKIFTVTLANGQVWRQLSGDTSYAHWNKAPGTYLVTIRHGAFRSFNLQVKDNPIVFKAERIR